MIQYAFIFEGIREKGRSNVTISSERLFLQWYRLMLHIQVESRILLYTILLVSFEEHLRNIIIHLYQSISNIIRPLFRR